MIRILRYEIEKSFKRGIKKLRLNETGLQRHLCDQAEEDGRSKHGPYYLTLELSIFWALLNKHPGTLDPFADTRSLLKLLWIPCQRFTGRGGANSTQSSFAHLHTSLHEVSIVNPVLLRSIDQPTPYLMMGI